MKSGTHKMYCKRHKWTYFSVIGSQILKNGIIVDDKTLQELK